MTLKLTVTLKLTIRYMEGEMVGYNRGFRGGSITKGDQ